MVTENTGILLKCKAFLDSKFLLNRIRNSLKRRIHIRNKMLQDNPAAGLRGMLSSKKGFLRIMGILQTPPLAGPC